MGLHLGAKSLPGCGRAETGAAIHRFAPTWLPSVRRVRTVDLSNDPAWVARGEYAIGDVPRDHASGSDHRLRTDLHPGTEDGSAAYPDVRPDLDRLAELLRPPQVGNHRVGGGVDLDRRAEQGIVPDSNPA